MPNWQTGEIFHDNQIIIKWHILLSAQREDDLSVNLNSSCQIKYGNLFANENKIFILPNIDHQFWRKNIKQIFNWAKYSRLHLSGCLHAIWICRKSTWVVANVDCQFDYSKINIETIKHLLTQFIQMIDLLRIVHINQTKVLSSFKLASISTRSCLTYSSYSSENLTSERLHIRHQVPIAISATTQFILIDFKIPNFFLSLLTSDPLWVR